MSLWTVSSQSVLTKNLVMRRTNRWNVFCGKWGELSDHSRDASRNVFDINETFTWLVCVFGIACNCVHNKRSSTWAGWENEKPGRSSRFIWTDPKWSIPGSSGWDRQSLVKCSSSSVRMHFAIGPSTRSFSSLPQSAKLRSHITSMSFEKIKKIKTVVLKL